MPSATNSTDIPAKKRKHEGEPGELKKKKKRRNNDSAEVESHAEESRSAKKETRKKDKLNGIDLSSASVNDSEILTQDTVFSSNKSVEKKKGSKQKAQTLGIAPVPDTESTTAMSKSLSDEDMVDAPAVPNGHTDTRPDADDETVEEAGSLDPAHLNTESSFQSVRMSMYLPIPAIGTLSPLSALLTVHLSPLLLTFFHPAGGVVLSYHDPVLSSRPQTGAGRPSLPPNDKIEHLDSEAYLKVGEEFGASWVWLTITLLVFRPERGDELLGWTNVMSEGFVGLVSYNYFQTSISKSRIPKTWTWNGPSRYTSRPKKTFRTGQLNDSDEMSQETLVDTQDADELREDDAIDGIAGSFLDEEGAQLPESLKFRVVDLEMIQAQERGRQFALQLEGTLLSEDDERKVRNEERVKWETRMSRHKSKSQGTSTPMMSGGLSTPSRAQSVISSA